ncbi:MAG: hypothetical protein IPM84_14670 [Anaerolineae bacterium]|nr:hypothetical protein [Anaerolineae bacterium]
MDIYDLLDQDDDHSTAVVEEGEVDQFKIRRFQPRFPPGGDRDVLFGYQLWVDNGGDPKQEEFLRHGENAAQARTALFSESASNRLSVRCPATGLFGPGAGGFTGGKRGAPNFITARPGGPLRPEKMMCLQVTADVLAEAHRGPGLT